MAGSDRSSTPALAKGSLILVTGASGFLASHIVNEALKLGYKVRGTSRSEEKAATTRLLFQNHPNYSTSVVANFEDEGALAEALRNVDAVIHAASDTSFGSDPNVVVSGTVQIVKTILQSAKRVASIKRFVLTSSSTAASTSNTEASLDSSSWARDAIKRAWAPPPYTAERAGDVYAASKAEAEMAMWEFVKTEKPGFVVNSILPNVNMGRILSSPGASGWCVPAIYHGQLPPLKNQYMIDVIDDARIHLAAAVLDSSLANERIFAYNVPFTLTDIINTISDLRPHAKSLPKPPENEQGTRTVVPNALGAELLKKWFHQQDGYKLMKQSVEENLEGIPE